MMCSKELKNGDLVWYFRCDRGKCRKVLARFVDRTNKMVRINVEGAEKCVFAENVEKARECQMRGYSNDLQRTG